MRQPNIFISASTQDFSRVRQHVSNLVLSHGCYPVFQQGFQAQPDNVAVREFLNLHLRACDGVIHLAGRHFGAEARRKSADSPRYSWTQMEYRTAKRFGKPILVCLADDVFYKGKAGAQTGSSTEQTEKARLQRRHYEALQKGSGLYYMFRRASDLTAPVGGFLRRFLDNSAADKVKVLYVGAEKGTSLDLRGELARIKKAVSSHHGRREIAITGLFNATASEIVEAVNRVQPSIVHLAGKQDGGTIKLHNSRRQLVPHAADQLASALARTTSKSLKLVILDTCDSMGQAKLLTKLGIGHAIGIYDGIADDVATEFYATLYSQLASGGDLATACEVARDIVIASVAADPAARRALEDVLEMTFNPEIHIPKVCSSRGLDAAHEFFT